MASPVLIGVDWGTSNFRAFLLDADGRILDRRAATDGILAVTDGRFDRVLAAQVGDWLSGRRLPVLMSGMIGSRQGWVEAPYVSTPAALPDLAQGLAETAFDGGRVRIVPGLKTERDGRADVIRGEETQIFGALAQTGKTAGRFLLPGSHSKWAEVEADRIVGFSTYMTGEIFAAARDHTILGRLMHDSRSDDAAFARGVAAGAAPGGPGALLHRLFSVRTAGLFGGISPDALSDYLSGLLIGGEIADAAAADRSGTINVIASHALAERYRVAAAALGLDAVVLPSDSIGAGHVAIARAAGLLGQD